MMNEGSNTALLSKIKQYWLRYGRQYILLIILIVIGIALSIASPYFLTIRNIMNIMRQISFIGIAAAGMTFIIISDGIDLSAGGIAAFSGVLVASLLKDFNFPVPFAIFCGLVAGLALGLFSGVVISKGKVPPFIATLVMMNIARGLAFIYKEAQPIYDLPANFKMLGSGYIGPIPIQVVILVGVMIIAHIVMKKTRFGRRIYAIGGSEESARLSGIKTDNLRISVYGIMGCLAALAGILLAARVNAGDPTSGEGLALDAIAAVVMGGTKLGGGKGRIIGSFFGAIIIGLIDNGLVLLQVSPWYQPVVKAVVILLAVLAERRNKNG